jgi:hypothetical protein
MTTGRINQVAIDFIRRTDEVFATAANDARAGLSGTGRRRTHGDGDGDDADDDDTLTIAERPALARRPSFVFRFPRLHPLRNVGLPTAKRRRTATATNRRRLVLPCASRVPVGEAEICKTIEIVTKKSPSETIGPDTSDYYRALEERAGTEEPLPLVPET